ncbi:MAG: ComF family protein [Candidatus Limnocylindrales bacterium]
MRAVLDLLLPPACAGCGREGDLLCGPCRAPLWRRLEEPPGVPIGLSADQPTGIVRLEWLAPFTGSTRAALHALKYGAIRDLAEPLADALAARWSRAGRGGDLVVPVPAHAARRRERGYDQAVLLAGATARRLGLPMAGALQRAHVTTAQHALGRGARATNVGHAFRLEPGAAELVRGRWIVLVDDILTTGATVAACAAVLDTAEARAASALVVARER